MTRAKEIKSTLPIMSAVQDTPGVSPTKAVFWLSRLVHRNHADLAKPGWPVHYSAKIEHEGVACYFPLGSDDRKLAARRAGEIYRNAISTGWPLTFRKYPREITLAIFWRRHPIVCTYTTLYTNPRLRPAPRPRPQAGSRRVILIEDDLEVLKALELWISGQPDFRLAGSFSTTRAALHSRAIASAGLCLFNQRAPDISERDLLQRLSALPRPVPAYSFGIFEVSDDIFASLSGVQEGYFLRRRPPLDMLEPIADGGLGKEANSPGRLDAQITSYFQEILGRTTTAPGTREPQILTSRELEVLDCVRKGYPDKQIAQALSIQPSTVHTHLKKMFEKLGVHTRTEAVMKHLQK